MDARTGRSAKTQADGCTHRHVGLTRERPRFCNAEKTQRLRQAKEEAEREIAHYRAHREEKYKKMLEEVRGMVRTPQT